MNINDVNFPYYFEFNGDLFETSDFRTAVNVAVHELIIADCTDRQKDREIIIKNRKTGLEHRVFAFAHRDCLDIWLARWWGCFNLNCCEIRSVKYN